MNARTHIEPAKMPTPIHRSKSSRFLQRRLLNSPKPETASFSNEALLNGPELSDQTSSLASLLRGHSFEKMTVWPKPSPIIQPKRTQVQPATSSLVQTKPASDDKHDLTSDGGLAALRVWILEARRKRVKHD